MKLTKVLYVPQAVRNILSISRIVLKGATMGAPQDKMIIKENGVSMTLDARKCQKKSMPFYLKANRYSQEGKYALINLPLKKMETSDEK